MSQGRKRKIRLVPELTFLQRVSSLVLILLVILAVVGIKSVEKNQIDIDFGSVNLEKIELANSEQSRAKGLSGRNSIEGNQAMLFVFDEASLDKCFWMKDMNFAIDMIWLDESKKVVDIKRDVTPDTYPKSFCPSKPAKYVLEVQAGLSKQAGVGVGSQL